jgi:antitoxin component of MazEF toxin-antitoxin module
MPLEQKLLKVGNSRAVSIPHTWLENAERTKGKKVVAIEMEVNGSIKIKPIFEKATN